MLPNSARIKSSSDFARVTKSGRRTTTDSLIAYLLLDQSNSGFKPNPNSHLNYQNDDNPKLGLIISKSVGNSVVRHRIARQIRHASFNNLSLLPSGSLLVIRAMKRSNDAFTETKTLFDKLISATNNLKNPKDQVRV